MSASLLIPPDGARERDHPLAAALGLFAGGMVSLERTHGQLQAQVDHPRQELKVSNPDLPNSSEENRRVRALLGTLSATLSNVLHPNRTQPGRRASTHGVRQEGSAL
jgi:hypothetical protein